MPNCPTEESEEVGPMARAGEEIYNPVQGDWIVFRETARDTSGELLSAELVVSPQAAGPPAHVHPLQEERFGVLSGTIRARLENHERSLSEGERTTVAPGTPHTWWNDSEEDARVSLELRPALNSEIGFETIYGLARDGKTDENGVPNLLQLAVIFSGVNKGELYLARPPIPAQKALFAALAPVGRFLGYKDHYPKYSAAEAASAGGAAPPSTTSVMARGMALVVTLLVPSFLLFRWARRLISNG
jgi:quercetin dioxygenase-like cupin family protein